jgi:hypothetical protein
VKTYQAVVVLGSSPDPLTWKFPPRMYACLDRARELVDAGTAPRIIVSGKWSILMQNQGIQQPFRECDVMADYLIQSGCEEGKILREGKSKDSISNLYYIKTLFLLPMNMKQILFVAPDFRIPRLRFLCRRILGSDYEISFEWVTSEIDATYDEPRTFKVQNEFLAPMEDGDHIWLADKFFSAPIYQP